MSWFALSISVGPVGDFIAAGRRSRDLWSGSRLVAELTRVAALRLLAAFEGKGSQPLLVYPAHERLTVPFFPRHQGAMITNKILATLEADDSIAVAALAEACRDAASQFLVDQLDEALDASRRSAANPKGRIEIVDRDALVDAKKAIQAGDFLEFEAAWIPILDRVPTPGDMRRCDGLLARRKTVRMFSAAAPTAGRRRSSVNPGVDSVLREVEPTRPEEAREIRMERARAGIRPDERLDAIGLVRRRALFVDWEVDPQRGDDIRLPPLSFPPVSWVAAVPWLRTVFRTPRGTELMRTVRDVFSQSKGTRADLGALSLLTSPIADDIARLHATVADFPFDPQLMFDGAVEATRREISGRTRKYPEDESNRARKLLGQLATPQRDGPLDSIRREFGCPEPYFALLVADGDGIGHLLARNDADRREELASRMYEFSDRVWGTFKDSNGVAFYAGGDELMGYVPLDRVAQALRGIRNAWDETVRQVNVPDRPTLSCAVVLAHMRDDLRETRRLANDALRAAKAAGTERIAVVDAPRAGENRMAVVEARELLAMGAEATSAFAIDWIHRMAKRGHLSMKLVHDITSVVDTTKLAAGDGQLVARLVVEKLKRAGVAEDARQEIATALGAGLGRYQFADFEALVIAAQRLRATEAP